MATQPNGPKEIRERRAARVAELRLRGLSIRAIAAQLTAEGITNPARNNTPYTHGTIANDIKKLSKHWQEAAAASTASLKGNQLAEIREARRTAWARVIKTEEGSLYKAEDLGEVRRLIEAEIKLMGTAEPDRSIIGGMEDTPLLIKGFTNVSPDDWED